MHHQPTEELIYTLLEIASVLEKRFSGQLSMLCGISFAEYRLLASLDDTPSKAATRVELAASVGLTPSAVSRALKPLEKIGFITNQKNARDSRQSLAMLTDAGVEMITNARALLQETITTLPATTISSSELSAFLRELYVSRPKRPEKRHRL